MTPPTAGCLVLRLAGPMQSWGGGSMFNRRDTATEATKGGLVGLLAAALGRRRTDPIEDLLGLAFGVRTDQPGILLRDYHIISDYRGRPLLSATVSAIGTQKRTSPVKYTHITERFYLQDAVFVAAVAAPGPVLAMLAGALASPAFPLALGRRACPPAQPLLLPSAGPAGTWVGTPLEVLTQVPWQAGPASRRTLGQRTPGGLASVDLPVTVDDPDGEDTRIDVSTTFDPRNRGFTSRPVTHTWIRLPVQPATPPAPAALHDPFMLLGGGHDR